MKLERLIPNLMVEDIRQTINYYHGVLGFETVKTVEGPDGEPKKVKVRKGDVEIMFQSEKSLKAELPELRHSEPAGGFTLVVSVKGVDDLFQYLYTTADVVDELRDTGSGNRKFTIRDVNGYYLTFSELVTKN